VWRECAGGKVSSPPGQTASEPHLTLRTQDAWIFEPIDSLSVRNSPAARVQAAACV
jgi:hypothetical protein